MTKQNSTVHTSLKGPLSPPPRKSRGLQVASGGRTSVLGNHEASIAFERTPVIEPMDTNTRPEGRGLTDARRGQIQRMLLMVIVAVKPRGRRIGENR